MISSVLFLVFILTIPVYPAMAYKVVIFDGHMHSKYSDEGKMTEGREISHMAEDVRKILEGDRSREKCAFAVTDHSDVVFKRIKVGPITIEKGLRSLFTDADWETRQKDLEPFAGESEVIAIPGEEVTVGNGKNEKTEGHFLVYGLKERVPYPFEGLTPQMLELDSEGPPGDLLLPESVWDGKPPRKEVAAVLQDVGRLMAFGYIAHPNGGPGWKDNWTSYAWSQARPFIGTVVKGIEVFSAGNNHSVQYGGVRKSKAWHQWGDYLKSGTNFFVIGGSDNHNGEFTFGGVVGPNIGSSFTYLLFDDNQPITESTVEWALRNGHTVASTGPFVNLAVTPPGGKTAAGPGDTVTVKKGDEVTITVEWNEGLLRGKPLIGAYLTIYRCFKSEKGKGIEPLPGWDGKPVAVTGETSFSYKIKQDQFLFAKLEVVVDYLPLLSWYTAYTSPVFVDPPGVKRPAVDVALVIDCSGSMSWNDPQGLRKEAAKQFIDLM
ncbi:MAG: hypothetical protein AB1426_13000, partial [Bacillota bacterium]